MLAREDRRGTTPRDLHLGGSMYESPILERFGTLRELTVGMLGIALKNPLAGGWDFDDDDDDEDDGCDDDDSHRCSSG
jgi:hypothetical protein